MTISKNIRAGLQKAQDAMRDRANKLLNNSGTASVADLDATPYKKGGEVKKEVNRDANKKRTHLDGSRIMKMRSECQKFAMGGVAKVRHDQATESGKPINPKKKSVKDLF